MSVDLVSQAAYILQAGDRKSAWLLLVEAIQQRPDDEAAWLWLSGAVESDEERQDCLERVLAIDPCNQAALAGLQILSVQSSAENTSKSYPPTEASLDDFLSEQEAIFSISPFSPTRSDPDQIPPETLQPVIFHEQPEPYQDFHPAPPAQMGFPAEPAALIFPTEPESPAGTGLHQLLAGEPRTRKRKSKKPSAPLIPWGGLKLTRDQALLFSLGVVIVFLALLIGFSVLKTILYGPRELALPAALPSPTALPTPIPEPTPQVYKPALVASDCRFSQPTSARVECLTISLPESRDGSSVRSVRLPLSIYHSLNPSAATDPVIYLHGGLETSAVEWAAVNFESFIRPLLAERDVIVFDGRGFGQATPAMDCPEVQNQLLLDLRQGTNLENMAEDFGVAVKACRDRLASQGIRLAQYSTEAMAADVFDIVELLGFEQVNLYGVSIGASVGQVVLREYPEIVRSLVLDSAIPMQGKIFNEIASGTEQAILDLFAACKADAVCSSQFPNLEGVYTELVGKLEQNPVGSASSSNTSQPKPRIVVDSLRFQEALRLALLSPDLLPEIPRGMYALQNGDPAFVENALAAPRMHLVNPAIGTMLNVLCSEHAYGTTPFELESGLEQYPRTAFVTRYALYGSGADLFELCDLWQAAPFDPQSKQPPVGATPTLILSGQLDPFAFPDLLEELAAGLQRSTLLTFPGVGHAVSLGEGSACPLSIVIAFLQDPYVEVEAHCMGEMRPVFHER